MRIGELSKRSGFSRDTIRYYEKMGLIHLQDDDRNERQFKDYSEAVLNRLQTIRKIKDFGFTLEETRGIMILFEEGALEPERGIRYVRRKIDRLDQQIRHMVTIRGRLQQIVDGSCSGHCPLGEVLHAMKV